MIATALPEGLFDIPAVRSRPEDSAATGTSPKPRVFLIDIGRYEAFYPFPVNLFDKLVAAQAAGHPSGRIRIERQRLKHFVDLTGDAVGVHNDETSPKWKSGDLAFAGQRDPPRPPGIHQKTPIRIPPLMKRVVYENPQPFCKFTKVAIGGEPCFHLAHHSPGEKRFIEKRPSS
jgi:hypothetical protein